MDESLPDDLIVDRTQREDDLPSPGAYIEAQRLRRGMSIEQLAVVTKIPARSIELLEADRFDDLPGQVFVKGFLRCCARSLGVSQQAVMDLLYERERAMLQARRKDRGAERPPERSDASDRAVAPAPAKPVAKTRAKKGARTEGPDTVAPANEAVPMPRPPRVRSGGRPAARGPSPVERLRELVPSAHALLWIVVAIFVAFLVLAAFNLAGAPVGAPQS